ncbi:hypothetical protein KFL_002600080 [Klebsormidium nitens]|uniref:Cysteine-rich DPF motif domain-containing protein 1 n=1 Tax=Klebsormidium nitens TaxID=105231 RepID=A0A1Y1I4N5_KLENI|nr:hypothetical protein KFL_002600080 [Klebsormidium nitens]|eukprot:GAQ85900.1 hypothetical protein KFL_002600080 [Klebsormidium nitens]
MSKASGGKFRCTQCALEVPFEHFGRRPPFGEGVVFLEDAYTRRDPFSSKATPLFLGGVCKICSKTVCRMQSCSIFYSSRFCVECASQNIEAFPAEVQKDVVIPAP